MAVASPARPRASSSRIFIIAGAALAALAFILIIFLGNAGHGGVGGGGTTNVVVAARDIPFRSALSRDDLKIQAWNGDIPPGAYKSIDDVIGKGAAQASPGSASVNSTGAVAEIKISQGQPITSNMLANSIDAVQVQPAYLPIPKGFQAATIPTSEQNGVAGFIQAGDYINIIANAQASLFTPQGQEDRVGTFTNVIFHCDDLHDTYEELSAKGVQFPTPPEQAPWGKWWAVFADPDGNQFGIGLASED